MTPEEMTEFVDRLYATCASGDWSAVEDMLTEDFAAHEADALPMAGTYRGKGGLRELFTVVMGMVDVAGLERRDLALGRDCAIAVLTMRFADPSLAPAELCEMMVFRGGLCCEIRPYYYDPAVFHAAVVAKAGALA
ncbi:nuclear transport factor 2 family protein [Novosphingobium sp. FGD1]|uniref:Nuclear transport factor 2 family protein n=2 Tax=Novosphingobium silvae TaxID=2692619 RepID=A0A7X4GK63_9SPHN|nr:nuclear transport factor 2 family protein [Novosphingobium silvae]MYM00099.1 nuclear transport factor 2 family protein [Novosphingobium silvae]